MYISNPCLQPVYEAYKKLLCGIKGSSTSANDGMTADADNGCGSEALQLINSLRDSADQENRAVENAAKTSKVTNKLKSRRLKTRK